ncbi:MAG: type II toxin-antitoxin system VapC family toxin [Candidatus Sericytochromatia bacterium]|nr:type II toxin-antitoxin system VapC family toxin [Candidatus Tanganyikabacteria bacterium]
MPFVIDASTVLAWTFLDEASERARAIVERLEDDTAEAPAVWPVEVANALLVAERRGRLSHSEMVSAGAAVSELAVKVEGAHFPDVLQSTLAVARRHALSAYDASYLELASRRNLPLATLDRRLETAARAAGIALL